MKDQNSQHGSGESNIKEGDFLMLVTEILNALIKRDFSGDEKSLILSIAKKTIGQHCELRLIKIADLITDTEIPRSLVFQNMKKLHQRGVVIKEKQKGVRGYFFGLNAEYFGRIYPGEIKNVYYLDKFKVREPIPSRSRNSDVKGIESRTKNTLRAAPIKNSANPSHISSHISSYSLRETEEFLNSRSQNTKKRWTTLVNNILSKHPDDESLLIVALNTVDQTQKDFLGNPIRSSALSLFENTDWEIIKSVLKGQSDRAKAQAEAKRQKEENERLIAELKENLKESPQQIDVDASKISPLFRKYAERGSK